MISNFNDIFAYILGALIICGMIYALFIELKTNIRDMKFDIKKEIQEKGYTGFSKVLYILSRVFLGKDDT